MKAGTSRGRLAGFGLAAVLLAAALLGAVRPQAALAAPAVTCTSVADGDWSAAATWSCDSVPTASDSVIIHSYVSLSTNQTIGSVSIESDAVDGTYAGVLQFTEAVTLNVTGNFAVDAYSIFDPGTGSVVLSGADQEIHTNGGTVDFYNLTKTVSSSATLAFDPAVSGAGGVHILNDLVLRGAAGQLLLLRSTTAGQAWQINPEKLTDVSSVDVMDSTNISTAVPQIIATSSTDSGNNTGWTFGTIAVQISSSRSPIMFGSPLTLTAAVSGSSVDGEVYFVIGDQPIDGCSDVAVVSGVATCTTSDIEIGEYAIVAVFYTLADVPDVALSAPLKQAVADSIFYFPLTIH
jgi:hypothetical protein